MLRNYLKIAFRNLAKNKMYSFINIGGLALGMAVAMLIALWAFDELTFNKYHKNYDHVAQVMRNVIVDGQVFTASYQSYPLADVLRKDYGGYFKRVVMAWPTADYVLSGVDRNLSRRGVFIEPDAPRMFSLEMVEGNWDGLQNPNAIILSESLANALFGKEKVLGKRLKINSKMDVLVTGVYKDFPRNSTFHELKFLSSFGGYVSANPWIKEQGWTNNTICIYAELQPNAAVDAVSERIQGALGRRLDKLQRAQNVKSQLFLHPMSNWHLYADFDNGVAQGRLVRTVWLISLIGGFVLLLACINFVNLSTAGSQKRAREVGIRKAIGSQRHQLIWQFLIESLLVVLFSCSLAILLTVLALPSFNNLTDKQLSIPWASTWFWVVNLGFILFTGLLAGSYPALYLSSFAPVKVLKGMILVGRLAAFPRKSLVVFQFAVSLVLIVSTLIVYKQIQFAKARDAGYNGAGLLMVEKKTDDFKGKYNVLRNELKKTGVVLDISEAEGKVTEVRSFNDGFDWKGKDPAFKEGFGTLSVTPEYGQTVGWRFIDGRDFSRDFASDSLGLIINEAAVTYMGLKNPVGELVRWNRKGKTFRIVGVIRNMLMESPYEPVKPIIYFTGGYADWINIKLNPQVRAGEAIPKIKRVFNRLIPSAPFEFVFADQDYARKFSSEVRTGQLAFIFAGLAILISCLGVFGLASFVAEQRTKEIGIRKVLGASALSIWHLLSSEFIWLVLIAFLIAVPITYYMLSAWLRQYQYRTEISWWLFVISGAGALIITLLTVSFQAIKSALMNPVKSLRSE